MQCPQCGSKMEKDGECPRCGATVVQHPLQKQYVKPESKRGLSLPVIVILVLCLIGFLGLLFIKSDAYKSIRAKRYFEDGQYAAAFDVLSGMIEKSGPNEYTVAFACDALRAEAEERMDAGKYAYAIPLFEKIIDLNRKAVGAGGDRLIIVRAMHDKAVCSLKLAQEGKKFVEPYGEQILAAEETLNEALELADTLGAEDKAEMLPEIHILSAIVNTERAVSLVRQKSPSHARLFLDKAEEQYEKAIELGINPLEYILIRDELDELGRILE
jgi:tetratricopeptide (TPR) repeat protein